MALTAAEKLLKQAGGSNTPRQPRSVHRDAAFDAGRRAFENPRKTGQPPEPEQRAPQTAVTPNPSPVASRDQSTKTSVYPSQGAKVRLKQIRDRYRVGESFVIEAALDDYLQRKSDEEIADELRRQGLGLRRNRTMLKVEGGTT